jgi:spore germination protein YaaH
LEDKGQNYTEYWLGDKRYRIWIEDEKSIGAKINLVDKYKLAGVASWRKGFERKSIWHVLSSTLALK